MTEGAAVTEDHEAWAACVACIRAVHDTDPARLQQLSAAGRPVTFEGVDWDAWRGRRPTRPVLAWGFVSGVDATITLTGRGVRGLPVGWEFQLRKEAGGWKVLRERSLRVDGR